MKQVKSRVLHFLRFKLFAESLCCLLFFSSLILSTNVFADDQTYLDYSANLQHLTDSENISNIEQALSSNNWRNLNNNVDLGFVKHHSWFRVDLPQQSFDTSYNVIEIGNIALDKVEFYLVSDGKILERYVSGNLNELSARPIQSRKIAFPIAKKHFQSANLSVYLRVSAEHKTFLPLRIWQYQDFIWYDKSELLYSTILLGAAFALGIFHLVLYFRSPSNFVILYSTTLFSMCCSYSIKSGVAYEYFWPEFPVSSSLLFYLSRVMFCISYILFLSDLFQLPRVNKTLATIFKILAAFFFALGTSYLFMPISVVVKIESIAIFIINPFMLCIASWLWFKGDSAGKYYLLSTSQLFIFVGLATVLEATGSTSVIVPHLSSFGVLMMVTMLAITVAHKIRKKEQQIASDLHKLNKKLEDKVASRSRALTQSLETLKQTQDKLIEAEKLAAMTHLISGIANRISAPLDACRTATANYKNRNVLMSRVFSENQTSRSALHSYLEANDSSIKVIEKGLIQSSNLVSGLKTLAIDNYSKNLIKTTLVYQHIENIINHFTKTFEESPRFQINCDQHLKADIATDLFEQLLAQLITNSITHAFSDIAKGRIDIAVVVEDSTLFLTYSDDGRGIESAELESLFAPFSTRDSSQGRAGLGTNAIHNIVVYGLNGTIKYDSQLGKGLTYFVQFPVKQVTE